MVGKTTQGEDCLHFVPTSVGKILTIRVHNSHLGSVIAMEVSELT